MPNKPTDNRTPRLRIFLVSIVLITGIGFTIWLQLQRTDEMFFTGDNGLKALMVHQFAAGVWRADLQLTVAPWVQRLWDQGLYPFGAPFVYEMKNRHYIQYPLLFPLITTPFYRLFGFRGETILPLMAIWLVWLAFLILCFQRGISYVSTAFGLAGLIFASSVTVYSAMFSEHTLAVAISFSGLVLAFPSRFHKTSLWRIITAGLLLGCSSWFRPESGIFIISAIMSLWWAGAGFPNLARLGIVALVPIAMNIVYNYWLFDIPLGLQSVQKLELSHVNYPHMSPTENLFHLSHLLIYQYPILLMMIGMALIDFLKNRHTANSLPGREEISAWVGILTFCLGTVFIFPNDGGRQIGPRYWSLLIPWIWFIAALRFNKLLINKKKLTNVLLMAGLVVLMFLGAWLNSVEAPHALDHNYQKRVLPIIQLQRKLKADVVAVSHQWISQGFQAGFEGTPFVRIKNNSELLRLLNAMADSDHSKFLWISYQPPIKPSTYLLEGIKLQIVDLYHFDMHYVAYGIVEKVPAI